MRIIPLFLSVILITVSSHSLQAENNPAKIRIAGSDTLGAKLVPQWIEAYRIDHPDVEFEVSAEGTSTGFAGLAENSCDIAMASRGIKPSEVARHQEMRGQPIESHLVALSPLALIVNKQNSVKNLTMEQVRMIYAGEIKDWKVVGGVDRPISLYSRNTSSGSYHTFRKLVMSNSEFSRSLQKLAG